MSNIIVSYDQCVICNAENIRYVLMLLMLYQMVKLHICTFQIDMQS